MQTTLLGIAIALILALAAALVGPHFVDWNSHRAEFETQASRLTGSTVRIGGSVEARLLPTPTLTLGQVEIVRPGSAGTLSARRLGIEFSLGALMSGQWRASEARLEGAEFAARLDESGRLDWLAPAIGIDPDSLAIERLDVVDGRVTLSDATSGARIVFDRFEFRGELRSLLGPVKGEGSFVHAGHRYPYRIATGRAGDAGMRVRLNLDPADRPLIAEGDLLIAIEHGIPRFEGSLQLTRPVGRAPDGIIQPWRFVSRIRGDSASAQLEQIEFQYGPEDRAVRLRGDAKLAFGVSPHMAVTLASTQIDLDRLLGLPEPARRRPLAAFKAFADFFGGAPRPPIPVRLGIAVENVTLAGAMLQRVSGELAGDADNWTLDALEFRAPGVTQVGLSGRLDVAAGRVGFDGRARIEARDPRALAAWLSDRADAQAITAGLLRAEGDVRLGADRIAITGLSAEIDRMKMAGRLAYSWASGDRPPRIELALSAPDIDFDRAYALVQGMLADTDWERPGEGALSLKVARATVAGVEAQRADIDLQFGRHGIEIARLAIGDFGGAALAVTGRIDTQTPGGAITADLDARTFDGVATLIATFAPQAAAELRRRAARLVPAKMRVTLAVGAAATRAAGAPGAMLRIDGRAGAFTIGLQAQSDAVAEAFAAATLARLGAAGLNLTGRLDADEGDALVELLGLDRLLAVDRRPGRFDLVMRGALDGDMALDGQLVAGGLDVSAKGTLRLTGGDRASADAAIRIAQANLRNPRPLAAGRPMEPLPVALSAKLRLAEGVVELTDIAGKAVGADIGGRLKIALARPITLDGDIDIAAIDLPTVIATATGTPLPNGPAAAVWSTEPFEQDVFGDVSGRLRIASARVALTPRLTATNIRAVADFDRSMLAFAQIDGTVAGGRVAGELAFGRAAGSVTARSRLQFDDADLAALLGETPPSFSGRLTATLALEGAGRSPIALIGALKGGGRFTVRDGAIRQFDPGAFDAAIRSVDQGLPIDPVRIAGRMEQALAAGPLTVALAEGEVTVADGQARLANTLVLAQGADLAVSGRAVLTDESIDARLILSGPARDDAPGGVRPVIAVSLKGPADASKRTLDVATFSNWLALRAVERQSKRIDALESGRERPAVDRSLPDPSATDAQPSASTPTGTISTVPQPRPRAPTPQAAPSVSPAPNVSPARPSPRPLDLQPPTPRSNSLLDTLLGR